MPAVLSPTEPRGTSYYTKKYLFYKIQARTQSTNWPRTSANWQNHLRRPVPWGTFPVGRTCHFLSNLRISLLLAARSAALLPSSFVACLSVSGLVNKLSAIRMWAVLAAHSRGVFSLGPSMIHYGSLQQHVFISNHCTHDHMYVVSHPALGNARTGHIWLYAARALGRHRHRPWMIWLNAAVPVSQFS